MEDSPTRLGAGVRYRPSTWARFRAVCKRTDRKIGATSRRIAHAWLERNEGRTEPVDEFVAGTTIAFAPGDRERLHAEAKRRGTDFARLFDEILTEWCDFQDVDHGTA